MKINQSRLSPFPIRETIDTESDLIDTVECITAKVTDNVMLKDCLHGEENIVFADRGYHQNNRTIEHLASEEGLAILVPTKKPKGGELTEQQTKSNRILSAIRAVVEHGYVVIKLRGGCRETLHFDPITSLMY